MNTCRLLQDTRGNAIIYIYTSAITHVNFENTVFIDFLLQFAKGNVCLEKYQAIVERRENL
jgi:hypothetical protein